MKRVVTAIVLIALAMLWLIYSPLLVFSAVALVIAGLALYECFSLADAYGFKTFRLPGYAALAIYFVAAAIGRAGPQSLGMLCFALLAILFAQAMRVKEIAAAAPTVAMSLLGFVYIAVPFALLIELYRVRFLILFAMVVVWIGDIAALYVGRSIGKHLMAPRISPKKTWEGAVASFVASVAIGWVVASYADPLSRALMHAGFGKLPGSIWGVAALSAAINVAAQTGDLAESLLKRGANVKDSGTIFPGHGGLLDRIDALLFAIPVMWYYALHSGVLNQGGV